MSVWVWAQVTLRDLQKRTNLSCLAMEVCLSIVKLQMCLLGFTHTGTTSSEAAIVPMCRGWVTLLHTAPHPTSTSPSKKSATNSMHSVVHAGICHTGSFTASYFFFSSISGHHPPFLQPPFLQSFSFLSLFTKLPTPLSPCTGGSANGSSSSHNS